MWLSVQAWYSRGTLVKAGVWGGDKVARDVLDRGDSM